VRPGKAACSSGGRSGCAIERLRNGPRSFDPPLALLLHVEVPGRADAGFSLRKGEIIALLYRYRYPREDATKLLRFIDWLIRLPLPLELALRRELAELEEQTKMSYVTSWERFAREEGLALGIEQGRQEGRHEGEAHALLRLLEAKFGPPPADLSERVRSAPVEQIDAWLTRVLTADRIEQVFDPL
jgi:hypothetical protein